MPKDLNWFPLSFRVPYELCSKIKLNESVIQLTFIFFLRMGKR